MKRNPRLSFRQVFDHRRQRIRGLWKRGPAFYARLSVKDPATDEIAVTWFRLKDTAGNDVQTVPAAVRAIETLRTRRTDGKLVVLPGRSPIFADYAQAYIADLKAKGSAKRPKTVTVEESLLRQICRSPIGAVHLHKVSPRMISAYQNARVAAGKSPRTVNLELSTIRNVFRKAIQEHLVKRLPFEGIKNLRLTTTAPRVPTDKELNLLCETCLRVAPVRGRLAADFLRLLAYCGARLSETLRLRWSDVDLDRRQLHIGTDGLSKSGKPRVVDFNPQLEAHLRQMHARRPPFSDFLFPRVLRHGAPDISADHFERTIDKARKAAGLPWFHCHLTRHLFISRAVMSGVDFMTIAAWVGHQDGGVLIGKVYGHLDDEHRKRQALKWTSAPA